MLTFTTAHLVDIDPVLMYRILQLRTDVFVVEQNCAYPELDGRDLEPDCLQVWGTRPEDPATPLATLRVLVEPDVLRIGRVVVHQSVRGTGVARQLFARGIAECERLDASLPILIDAQAPLEAWYGAFGFVREGENFIEDGIPHVVMRRAARGV